jgi:hypothetical protein
VCVCGSVYTACNAPGSWNTRQSSGWAAWGLW